MAWHSSSTTAIIIAAKPLSILYYLLLYYYLISTLLVIDVVHGQLDSNGCLLLSSSKTCPQFNQYYIGITDQLKSTYSFLSNVTDVTSFDNALSNYVSSTSYLQQLGCTTSNNNKDTQQQQNNNDNNNENDNKDEFYPRYSLSRLCALFVHDATSLLSCNYGQGITPEPLCQSTCNDWIDSLKNATSSSSTGTTNDDDDADKTVTCSSSIYGSFELECSSWPAFAGTSGSCILGSDNEPDNCGFHDDKKHACEYCETHSDDDCCQNMSCINNALSAGAIAGIVVGAIVGLLAIFVVYYIFCWRRTRDNTRFLPIIPVGTNDKNGLHHHGSGLSSKVEGDDDYEAREHLFNNNNNHNNSSTIMNYANGAGSVGVATTAVGTASTTTAMEMEEKTQLPSPNPVEMAELFCEVIHSYPPQVDDELDLRESDVVYLIFQLDDGWGYGLNLSTSQTGVFPLVCVTRAREELLEQLLLVPSDQEHFSNDKVLIEEDEDEEQAMLSANTTSTMNNLGAIVAAARSRSPSPNNQVQLEKTPTSATGHSLLQWRMQQIRDDVRRSISVNSLKRISRQPRPAPPPVKIHHHNTLPTKRVTDQFSPQQQLFSAPVTSSLKMTPPPPVPRHMIEEHEMHSSNP